MDANKARYLSALLKTLADEKTAAEKVTLIHDLELYKTCLML